jgi:hypothetical protein
MGNLGYRRLGQQRRFVVQQLGKALFRLGHRTGLGKESLSDSSEHM